MARHCYVDGLGHWVDEDSLSLYLSIEEIYEGDFPTYEDPPYFPSELTFDWKEMDYVAPTANH